MAFLSSRSVLHLATALNAHILHYSLLNTGELSVTGLPNSTINQQLIYGQFSADAAGVERKVDEHLFRLQALLWNAEATAEHSDERVVTLANAVELTEKAAAALREAADAMAKIWSPPRRTR